MPVDRDDRRETQPEGAGRAAAFGRAIIGAFGHKLALFAMVLFALGWFVTGPRSVARHATESPFRVDYLAYDTAATIIRQGDAERLYDPNLQHETQSRRTGTPERGYLAYLNPPVVGAAFMPLTRLDARASYVVAVVLLTFTMAAASALMFRMLIGLPARTRCLTTICILGSTTTASALLSGQLTPVVLLFAAASLMAYRADRPVTAGAILGLLFIKPHFALAALVVLLVARQRKLVACMATVAGAGALASALIVGPSGISGYVSLMRQAYEHPASLYIDVRTEQNLRGFLSSVFQMNGGDGIALASAALVLLTVVVVARAVVRVPYAGTDRAHYLAALAATFVVCTAPHIQYYDLGLIALPALFIIRRAEAAQPEVRARFYGVLVLTVAWLEFAGILEGASLSVSFVPLIAFTLLLCEWPRVETWLTAPPSGARHRGAEPLGTSQTRTVTTDRAA